MIVPDVHCKLIPLINPYLKQPLIRLGKEVRFLLQLTFIGYVVAFGFLFSASKRYVEKSV